MAGQRRGTAIAMTGNERDAFLRAHPLCRVATVGPGGHPHVSALWFVWDGAALWLNSLIRSQRWADPGRDPRLSVIVDDGGRISCVCAGLNCWEARRSSVRCPAGASLRTHSPGPNGSTRTSTWAAAASGTTAGTAGSGSPRRRS